MRLLAQGENFRLIIFVKMENFLFEMMTKRFELIA